MIRHGKQTLAAACDVLARLVRSEYPSDKTLAEIAEIWGDATEEELEALREIESQEK